MDNTLLEKTATALGEQYESVLILVSTHEDDKTYFQQRRTGNLFTAQGMARNYLKIYENRELAEEIAFHENNTED